MQETTIAPNAATRSGTQIAHGLTLSEAQELLDWLENHGVEQREVDLDDEGRITVRWTE